MKTNSKKSLSKEKKTTEERVEKLISQLRGYEKCDRDFLDQIVDKSGYPQETLFDILENSPDEEDIKYIEDSILELKAQTIAPVQEDATVNDLRALSSAEIDPTEHQLTSTIYEELGKLVAKYSAHRETHTVYFRDNKLVIKPEDAFEDGSKDTFEDNGIVSLNYYKLLETIIDFARATTKEDPLFKVLAKLYASLTTLSDEACNQQNAIDIATVLNQYEPIATESSASSSTVSLHSDPDSSTQSNNEQAADTKENNTASNDAKTEGKQRSGEASASSDDQQQDNQQREDTSSNIIENKAETDTELYSLLQIIFGDIELLPKWLQDTILNSSPVQMIIESIAATKAIYNPKTITEKFEENFSTKKEEKSFESVYYDDVENKATYLNDYTKLVDTSYIYTAAKIGIVILPMLGISVIPDEIPLFGQIGIETI